MNIEYYQTIEDNTRELLRGYAKFAHQQAEGYQGIIRSAIRGLEQAAEAAPTPEVKAALKMAAELWAGLEDLHRAKTYQARAELKARAAEVLDQMSEFKKWQQEYGLSLTKNQVN